MKLHRKAITVFGIIALLAVLNVLLFQDYVFNGEFESIITPMDNFENSTLSIVISGLLNFLSFTGFHNASFGHIVMIIVGLIFILSLIYLITL